MVKLLTIEQASEILNVPKASLRTAAEEHGYLVRIGRAVRIDQDQLRDLVEKCKIPPIGETSSKKWPRNADLSEQRDIVDRCKKAVEKLKLQGRKKS
ncbi:helix-turn-helix domain-containing protein [Ruegeria sp. HKCCA0370]|uniref:helix-turn-helix domain-containing protein n=1 Tax=Ruegeria sp. HKCCA0370 TaxID=2682995 RepID=UPI001487BED4|nr:helix-turn-helix domain-containing protein [Ruegeria sp. HKCCA0370]